MTPTPADRGEGKELKEGDIILIGDKWWDDHFKRWSPIHPKSVRNGSRVRIGERILRPISATPVGGHNGDAPNAGANSPPPPATNENLPR